MLHGQGGGRRRAVGQKRLPGAQAMSGEANKMQKWAAAAGGPVVQGERVHMRSGGKLGGGHGSNRGYRLRARGEAARRPLRQRAARGTALAQPA